MWLKWLPWKIVVGRLARSHGFLDPVALLARLHRFAQPSEVGEPVELLRAGAVLHARGLMNSRAIQHNLDWVWPFWVERQFNPTDPAFVPRAFSLTHINLTHRNWTALGLPGYTCLPIVDPRGLVTPHYDGWSIDGWVIDSRGRFLIPARAAGVRQELKMADGLSIATSSQERAMTLVSESDVILRDGAPVCRIRYRAEAAEGGWAVVSLRPYNPEGVSFVHEVTIESDEKAWRVDGRRRIEFDQPADRHEFSDYRDGDIYIQLPEASEENEIVCDVGMATAAALFKLEPGRPRELCVCVELDDDHDSGRPIHRSAPVELWRESLADLCELKVPDERFQFLYDAALRTLVLLSPDDVYPGPYTYRRFWFRDAAFILHAMLCCGLARRAERALERFASRQTRLGYFHSQDGEWDSNGEALWILKRYCELTGEEPKRDWRRMIERGARWIVKKRLADDGATPHSGLFPAGFSAEHLGPNDYYYWDDFWGVAGLRAAADLMERTGAEVDAERFRAESENFMQSIERSLLGVMKRVGRPAMTPSPYRRLDAGSIGSIVAGYPLQLWPGDDPRLTDTVQFLIEDCFLRGAFFQDMIHSGLNPYLTLHVAQLLLRAGDARHFELMESVADLASPTGQWPEAVHPHTGGGCMGDGQHGWAAAEWLMMMRNCFVREEDSEDKLILASGIPRRWLQPEARLSFGPAPTRYGPVTVAIASHSDRIVVNWEGNWRGPEPNIEVRLPGHDSAVAGPGRKSLQFALETVS